MASNGGPARVRLAELVAALSLGIDLGFGQPMEHVLRQCLIALRLAERMGLDEEARAHVYYTALLVNVGCHTDAHEQAKWFGDDIAMKSTKYDYEFRSLRGAGAMVKQIGAGNPLLHRFRVGLEFVVSGHRDLNGMVESHAALARSLAAELDLPDEVKESLVAAYETWDGRGWPGELKGEDVPLPARLAQFAEFVEVANRVGGVEGAKALARKRSGKQFDPAVAKLVVEDGELVLAGVETVTAWDDVIDAEPALAITLTEAEFDSALAAIANFVDLKSPYFLGHALAVAELAAAAADSLGLDATLLRRAGLVHGLGRLGISNAILDKRGPLGAGEWERVRLQPYLTERMLGQADSLAPLAAVAGQTRERLDGSGYPLGLAGGAISRPARVLAAAEAYQAMREPRPHRPELSADAAAAELRADATKGRLDRTRSGPFWEPPVTASRAVAAARPVSPPARSRCSVSSRAASRTRRSPAAW